MSQKAFFACGALAIAALVAGCAAPGASSGEGADASRIRFDAYRIDRSSAPRSIPSGECRQDPGAACVLKIKVGENCDKDPTQIDPEFDYLHFKKRGSTPVEIQIVTDGWDFDTNGIKFYAPAGQIVNVGKIGPRKWLVINRADQRGVFHYEINVASKNKKCHRDPGFVNDWP